MRPNTVLGLAAACLRISAAEPTDEIEAPRALERRTFFVTGERGPAVLLPRGRSFGPLEESLRGALAAKVGLAPEVVSTVDEARVGRRTVIAVGNALSNALITRLYFNGYSYEDSLCPEGDSYVLRVAHDPYPWRGKTNVVILGCETPAGGRRAADAMMARLQGTGVEAFLPYTLVVSEDATPHTPVGSRHGRHEPIANLPPAGEATAFMRCADAYLRTGNDEAARRAIASMEHFVAAQEANPGRDLGGTAWVKEFEFFRAAFPFEYCPLLTDELRLEMARILLRCADDMWHHRFGYPTGKGVGPTWNHNTEPLMGAYMAGRHFLHYYGVERCKEYIATANECFAWQCKSWRSAEDSSAYLTYSSLSGMRWSLAEWDLAFFESGLARKHADFIVTACDQSGRPGGFGDGSPTIRIVHESLPLVYWYTRDADLLWLLNHCNRMALDQDWPNPWWRDVDPERDARFTGVHWVAMDPLLYARTLKIPYYSGMVVPTTTVRPEEAVDKIAFREGWERDSQFAMVDGFGRGYHLNYDTQAITTLRSDDEEWLMDRDYLERDPARHTMLRILFNGRCRETVPAFARLDAHVRARAWGMTRTTVPDYNHSDWSRSLVWRKGKYFLLVDQIVAGEDGDYAMDLGFRMTSWPENRQRMTGPRTFLAERSIPKPLGELFEVVEDAAAEGGKAVDVTHAKARLEFNVDLPAGPVRVEVRGTAEDPSHDTVWVTVDGTKVHCGFGKGRYGGSPSEAIHLGKAGVHRLEVWPREAVPFRLDNFTLLLGDGTRKVLEAEALLRERPDTTKRFTIQSADDVRMVAHNEWVDRLRRNRMYVRQRRTGHLKEGDTRCFASLLVPTAPARPGSYGLARLGPRAFLVTGDEPALIAFGRFVADEVSIDATCALISPAEIAATGVKALRVAGFTAGPGGEVRASLAEAPEDRAAVEALLRRLAGLPERPDDEEDGGWRPVGFPLAGEPTPPAWEAELPPAPAQITGLCTADLDADGVEEILVARGSVLHCLTPRGKQRWQVTGRRTFNDVAVGSFRPGPRKQVLAGGNGEYIHLIDADGGSLARTRYNDSKAVVNNFVNTVTCADIDGDGIDEALAGGRDQRCHLYDASLRELLRFGQAPHGATAIRCGDRDGDGRQEVFAANRYGSVYGYSLNDTMSEAEYIFYRYLSIGDVCCDVGDIDGDGRPEVVLGVSTGDLAAAKPDKDFENMMFRFDNFGYDVTATHIRDMNADGSGDVVVGSKTGYVYVLDGRSKGEGRCLLAHRVGHAVLDAHPVVAPGGEPSVLAGDANGRVVAVGMKGEELFGTQAPESVVKVAVCSSPDAGRFVVAATADGRLLGYGW